MKKMILYIDFDGVILDTIRVSYQMIDERNLQTRDEIEHFYKNLDWENLLKISPILNESISCIEKLIKSNKFDIKILTHVNTEHEVEEKNKFITKHLPGVPAITCPKEIEKSDFVDPYNCILVDDYIGNLTSWKENGGIAVKFSDNGKLNDDFMVISKLDQLLHIDFQTMINNSKMRVKNRQCV